MKSNQLTDRHLRGLSLLSNCKWPTSLSTFSFSLPYCSSSQLLSLSENWVSLPDWKTAIWFMKPDVVYIGKLRFNIAKHVTGVGRIKLLWLLCRPYTGVMKALFSFHFSAAVSLPPHVRPLCTLLPPPCMPCVHPSLCVSLTPLDFFAWATRLVVRTTDMHHAMWNLKAWRPALWC